MFLKFHLTSFENSSITRKFTIFYFLVSVIPLGVLDYLYMQLQTSGSIQITAEDFMWTLMFVVAGVIVGYVMMRSILVRIVEIAQKNASTVAGIVGPEKAAFLGSANSNEITILTEAFSEITSRLEENVRNLESAKRTLHSVLAKVGEGMASLESIDSFLSLILETVTQALQAKEGVLLLVEEKGEAFFLKSVFGRKIDPRKRIRVSADNPVLRQIASARQAVVLNACEDEEMGACVLPPALAAPLLLHDRLLGVILVSGRKQDVEFSEEEKNILSNLALQTAVAVENSRLNDDAEKTYFETISALAMAVEAKDTYSRGHSDRVAQFAVQIANELGLSQEDITALRDAAKLHDLGKIGILDRILKKAGPLNTEEMEMMKKHAEIGEGIIKPIRSLRYLCDVIRHHHEKLDGSGYPDGLKGDEIKPLVRILTVADIFDALTTNRPYREPFTPPKAIDELRVMGSQIDQRIVNALEHSLHTG